MVGTDAVLLVGYVPDCCKPDPHLGTGLVEYGADRNGGLKLALETHDPAARRSTGIACLLTLWTNESDRPAKMIEKCPAGILRVKPIQELHPVPRVVFTCDRHFGCGGH